MRILLALGLALLGLAACAPPREARSGTEAGPAAPASEPVTLRVGMNVGASDAGIFLAMDRGYFAEQGFEIDVTRGSTELMPSVATGDLDVLAPSVSAAMLNAMARDIPLRVVADKGSD